MTVSGESSLLILISTHETFFIFSFPCSVAEGSDREAFGGSSTMGNCADRTSAPRAKQPQVGSDLTFILSTG